MDAVGRSKPLEEPSPGDAEGATDAARLARRERRRDRSREEILEAARDVVLRNGVAATTLEAVAREVGVSKTALYYYFPSKDALLFELMFATLQAHAAAVHDAVEGTEGTGALAALIGATVKAFAPRLEDFRLAFLESQLARPGTVRFEAAQFERIRPLNDLILAGASEKLADGQGSGVNRAGVEPRLLAFLAYLAALGLLTMKGLVESVNDPLKYSDDEMIAALASVFGAAAEPR